MNINLNFYKALIDTQFFILDKQSSKINRTNNYILSASYDSKAQTSIQALNVFTLLSTTKQLIRLFQFLNKETNPVIFLLVKDPFQQQFIKKYLDAHKLSSQIKLNPLRPAYTDLSSTKLILDLGCTKKSSSTSYNQYANQNIFLITRINALLEKIDFGGYKIYNDLNEFNKLLFLLTIINVVFKNPETKV